MMRFDEIIPAEHLRPYVKRFVISEAREQSNYKVFPSTELVIGFQYGGSLALCENNHLIPLKSAGITGISDHVKVFQNSPDIGTILVFFTETGVSHFSTLPVNELFNQSVSLEHLFDKHKIARVEEKLKISETVGERIRIVEHFLMSEIKHETEDLLILEAVRQIYLSGGNIRVKELNEKLFISQSSFEKRFRKIVGTSPKKFASIVRFNAVLKDLGTGKSLIEICYENNFFDQSHFIHDFQKFTGESPEHFIKQK
ncbi:MAG: helix-turn-helix domain-containing protein [Bacteroidota bacterium]